MARTTVAADWAIPALIGVRHKQLVNPAHENASEPPPRSKTDRREDATMSEMGKSHIVIMWIMGPDDVAEGDALFAVHAKCQLRIRNDG